MEAPHPPLPSLRERGIIAGAGHRRMRRPAGAASSGTSSITASATTPLRLLQLPESLHVKVGAIQIRGRLQGVPGAARLEWVSAAGR